MSEEPFTIQGLLEANDILQEELTRLRDSNRLLRNVNRAIRGANASLQRQVELAKANDELFKQFCSGAFDAPGQFDAVVEEAKAEGGLPEAGAQAEQSV
jgi:hypothetical protein